MSREIKRVPEGFGWPLRKTWEGYFTPDYLREKPCPDCEIGYSAGAEALHSEWYGKLNFDPRSQGSEPFAADGEEARAWALRQIEHNPGFYGTGEAAIAKEALRISKLWNSRWMHHLSQADVDALVEAGRLWDFTRDFVKGEGWVDPEVPRHPTAAEVNLWSLMGMAHDSINASVCVAARAEREGIELLCATCGGNGSVEAFSGQRATAESWVRTEVPSGEAWQLWESTSEGSPITPAFSTAEALAEHISRRPELMGSLSMEAALNWIENSGWAPTFIVQGSAA